MMARETLALVMALSGDTAVARISLVELADWYERQPERLGA